MMCNAVLDPISTSNSRYKDSNGKHMDTECGADKSTNGSFTVESTQRAREMGCRGGYVVYKNNPSEEGSKQRCGWNGCCVCRVWSHFTILLAVHGTIIYLFIQIYFPYPRFESLCFNSYKSGNTWKIMTMELSQDEGWEMDRCVGNSPGQSEDTIDLHLFREATKMVWLWFLHNLPRFR